MLLSSLLISFYAMSQENQTTSSSNGVILPQKPHVSGFVDHGDLDCGYFVAIEANGGSTVMFKRRNTPFIGADVVNGYRFNEYLRVGVGLGAKVYTNNDEVRKSSIPWTFPIYADVRGNMVSQRSRSVVPYWNLNIGTECRDGFFFSPIIGLRVGENRSSFLIGVGYSYNQMETFRSSSEGRDLVVLKLGYEY